MSSSEKKPIIIDSKINKNQYFLYEKQIIVKNNNKEKFIILPKNENNICFYDIYYNDNILYVITITEKLYDYRYILDEKKLELIGVNFSK